MFKRLVDFLFDLFTPEPKLSCYGCGKVLPISQLLQTNLYYMGDAYPVNYCLGCGRLP